MKSLFLVLCHRLTPALEYLISCLDNQRDCTVVIHVDRKSCILPFESLVGYNTFLVDEREEVNWGEFSQVRSTLRTLSWIEEKGIEFDYVSVMSGDDVLVQSADSFRDFLSRNKGLEFIGVSKSDGIYENPSDRVDYRYPRAFFKKSPSFLDRFKKLSFRIALKMGLFKNPYSKTLPRLYKGSSWFTISKDAVQYILYTVENNENLLKAFEQSYCADEVFFQTLLVNSKFKRRINCISQHSIDDNKASLRYIDWSSGPEFPKILSVNDICYVATREGLFFARKVDSNISVRELKSCGIEDG